MGKGDSAMCHKTDKNLGLCAKECKDYGGLGGVWWMVVPEEKAESIGLPSKLF